MYGQGHLIAGKKHGMYGNGHLVAGDKNGARIHPEKMTRGEKCHSAVLAKTDVYRIRKLKAEGLGPAAIVRATGLSYKAVEGVYYGTTWMHLL